MKKSLRLSTCRLMLMLPVLSLLMMCKSEAQCGKERWPIKTLADGPLFNLQTKHSSVAEMVKIIPPSKAALHAAQTKRFPQEQMLWEVQAFIIAYKVEADSDLHIVLADAQNKSVTMIAEIPSSHCTKDKQMRALWDAQRAAIEQAGGKASLKLHKPPQPIWVSITGLGFFDFLHHQIGAAPNGIELHPVIKLTM